MRSPQMICNSSCAPFFAEKKVDIIMHHLQNIAYVDAFIQLAYIEEVHTHRCVPSKQNIAESEILDEG